MNLRVTNEILMRIFLDNFLITTSLLALLTATVALFRFSIIKLPRISILAIWYAIVIPSVLLLTCLIVDFFSPDKGLDRVARIPLFIGVSPLFLCSCILIFVFPGTEKTRLKGQRNKETA